jgi:hypothetical protein
MKRYRPLTIIVEGQPIPIGGRSIDWRDLHSTGKRVPLPHPDYPDQLHEYSVVTVGAWPFLKWLAVGELSAGVYGIYIYR